jgi:hypothetical protein
LEDFQTYVVDTPLSASHSLVSFSIVLGDLHNHMRPIDDLLDIGLGDLKFSRTGSFDGLLDFLVSDAPISIREQLKWDAIKAIDQKSAIVYSGSINSANSPQLSKLPTIIRGFAGLSSRQFRVGLFRLSTTIIVISIAGGVAAYSGWAAAKKLHEVATTIVPSLSPRDRSGS